MPRNFDLEGSDQLTSVIWKLYLGIIIKMPLKGSRHEPISIMSCQGFWNVRKEVPKITWLRGTIDLLTILGQESAVMGLEFTQDCTRT